MSSHPSLSYPNPPRPTQIHLAVPRRPIPSHLIPSHPVPSQPTLSHRVPSHSSHLIPSHPISSHLISSNPTPSHPIPTHPNPSHHISSYLVTSHPMCVPFPIPCVCILPFISHPISPSPILLYLRMRSAISRKCCSSHPGAQCSCRKSSLPRSSRESRFERTCSPQRCK